MKCLAVSTRKAARGITRVYDECLEPARLSAAQFALLSQLVHSPGASQQALCEATDLDQTTLSRNLRGMAEHGWVRRGGSAEDKRAASYRVTAKGAALQQKAMPLWKAAQQRMRQQLGEDWQQAFALLERIREVATASTQR